jgi:hypothetical protein
MYVIGPARSPSSEVMGSTAPKEFQELGFDALGSAVKGLFAQEGCTMKRTVITKNLRFGFNLYYKKEIVLRDIKFFFCG